MILCLVMFFAPRYPVISCHAMFSANMGVLGVLGVLGETAHYMAWHKSLRFLPHRVFR